MFPDSPLVQATDGYFYGTTTWDGAFGYGTIYRISPDGTGFTVLHNFSRPQGYANPHLIQASDGYLYGTTCGGGINERGTVFRMTLDGAFVVLDQFEGVDGRCPKAPLIEGSDGYFYGTTFQGGSLSAGFGTIFRVSSTGTITKLHSFDGGLGGLYPDAPLVQTSDGSFYGSTNQGGAYGGGTIFRLTPEGTFTKIYDFERYGAPYGLVAGSDGNFYGTTDFGGAYGYGSIFRLTPDGTYTPLYEESGFNHANHISGIQALIQASDGMFYGVATSYSNGVYNTGVVFSMTAAGEVTVLHRLSGTDGSASSSMTLVQGRDGSLYGTTYRGRPAGALGGGVVFRFELPPAANRPPVAVDDAFEVAYDTEVLLNVLSNDSDPDKDPLSIAEVTLPTNGVAIIAGGGASITYRPGAGFAGQDTFSYTVSDGRGGSDTATVVLTVGVATPPPPVGGCAADAQRKVHEFHYSASINGSHLFDFFPTISYCWDGVNAAVTKSWTYGFVDSGVLLGTLDALGFVATYNPIEERAQFEGNVATFIGSFEIAYNLTGLVDKLGLKEKLEKFAAQKLGRKLARTIAKDGYSGEFQARLQEFIVFTTAEANSEIEGALKQVLRGLPDSLAREIETLVLKEVEPILAGWRDKVQASLSSGEFVGWTAEEVSGHVMTTLFEQLAELTTVHFQVWGPIIKITVRPDGELSATVDESFVNPFLSVKRER